MSFTAVELAKFFTRRKLPYGAPNSGKVTDFVTHFSFVIDNRGLVSYGHGLAFFLAPVGFTSPLNSAAGFLGLFEAPKLGTTHRMVP